jgi:hypothetical protein
VVASVRPTQEDLNCRKRVPGRKPRQQPRLSSIPNNINVCNPRVTSFLSSGPIVWETGEDGAKKKSSSIKELDKLLYPKLLRNSNHYEVVMYANSL